MAVMRTARIGAARPQKTPLQRGAKTIAMLALAGVGKCGMTLLQRTDPWPVSRQAGRLMRAIGPRLRSDYVARSNLRAAFPEKSPAEIDVIVNGVWNNVGRVLAEFGCLDRLWDYEPGQERGGRIVIENDSAQRLDALRAQSRPALFFSAHTGNWEILPRAIEAFGFRLCTLYKSSGYAATDDLIRKARGRSVEMIPASAGALHRVRTALRAGSGLALHIDQYDPSGIEVQFFGRPCRTNPTLAWAARAFEYPLHAARVIRLPDERFKIEVTDALAAPRDGQGRVDIAGTMQMATGVLENWIREYPDQWLWVHRRWR